MSTELVSTPTAALAQRQAQRLRRQISALLATTEDLVEWNTRTCPDCGRDVLAVPACVRGSMPHLPPLYYALAPEDDSGDRALGLGSSAVAALADLLWNVKANVLLQDIRQA